MKNSAFQTTILLALLVALLSSCSITMEKRLYRRGYHIDTYAKHQKRTKSDPSTNTERPVSDNLKVESKNEVINWEKQDQKLGLKNFDSLNSKVEDQHVDASLPKFAPSPTGNEPVKSKKDRSLTKSSKKIKSVKKKKVVGGLVFNLLSLIFSFIAAILTILGWVLPLGFVPLLILMILGFVFGVTGTAMSGVGLRLSFKGLAIPALILGILSILASIAGMIFGFVVFL